MPDAYNTENVRAGLTGNESFLLSALSEKGKTILGLKDIVEELKYSSRCRKYLCERAAFTT